MPIESGHTYFITNVENKNYMDLSASDPKHISIIGYRYVKGNRNQQWIFELVPKSKCMYTLKNELYQKYVGCAEPLEPGAIVIATVGLETAVQWVVLQDEDSDAYRISVAGQELYLTLPSSDLSTPIELGSLLPTDKRQFWEIRPVG